MTVRETLRDWGGVAVLLAAMGRGYILLSGDIDRLAGRIDRLDGRIDRIDDRLDDIVERLTRVERTAAPDYRGHAIFKHLGPAGDGFTGRAPYHPHTRFAGTASVRCDGGAVLAVDILTLHRLDPFTWPGSVAAFGWAFADCTSGTITTLRHRYLDLAAHSRARGTGP